MANLEDVIVRVVGANAPMTVRQVVYQLVSSGVIEKSESEYRAVVVRLLTRAAPRKGSCRGAEVHFERIAVRREQIDEYALPTRPTKRSANHGRGLHEGESVEVDALPPAALLGLVRSSIERHVDPARVAVLEAAEASERELLGGLPAMLRAAG